MQRLKIVVAPNSFKTSLDATEAAAGIINALQPLLPDSELVSFPIGDGGDGTGQLLRRALNATSIECKVTDPLGRPIIASFGYVNDEGTVIIEMADASGLRLLEKEERDVMSSSSYGTGQMILESLKLNPKKILLCVGGTATVDGGLGILTALGVTPIDSAGERLDPIPSSFRRISDLDFSGLHQGIKQTEVVILCDVKNTLLGDAGAARVFAPQKGANPDQVEFLESGLTRLCSILEEKTGRNVSGLPHGGAAGGVAAALNATIQATLVNGIEYFLDLTRFDNVLNGCDLVITGEGRLDSQTLQGKGPMGVALRAKKKNIKVIGIAGQVEETAELKRIFDALIPINSPDDSLKRSIVNTRKNLEGIGPHVVELISGWYS